MANFNLVVNTSNFKPFTYEEMVKPLLLYKQEEEARQQAYLDLQEKASTLEALAASGLRSIRYWKEIPNIRRIIINDIADAAVESMKDNLAYNNITSDRVVPNQAYVSTFYF